MVLKSIKVEITKKTESCMLIEPSMTKEECRTELEQIKEQLPALVTKRTTIKSDWETKKKQYHTVESTLTTDCAGFEQVTSVTSETTSSASTSSGSSSETTTETYHQIGDLS